MRIFLILLIVLAAVVTGGVVLLPRLIDPLLLRDRVMAELQRTTGRPMTVRGGAELSLLPRPTLTIGPVTLGRSAGDGGGPLLVIDRIDFGLEPATLLGVGAALRSVRLLRPRLTLHAADIDLLRGMAARALAGEGTLHEVEIVDGGILTGDPADGPEDIDHISLDIARSERNIDLDGTGRWRQLPISVTGHATVTDRDQPLPIQLRLGLGEEASLLEVIAGGTLQVAGQFDGDVRVNAAEFARPLALAMTVVGRPVDLGDSHLGRLSLRARTRVTADGWRIDVPDVAVGSSSFKGLLTLSNDLHRFDLGIDGQSLTVTPDLVAIAGALGAAAGHPSNLTGAVDLRFAVVEWRGQGIRDARLLASLQANGSLNVKRLSARLPGGGDLMLTGLASAGAAGPTWQGQGSLSAPDLPALAAWLRLPLPAVAPDRLRSLVANGSIGWSDRTLTLRELDLLLDNSRARGSLALQLVTRPQLAARLSIDRLSLDAYAPAATPSSALSALAPFAAWGDVAVTLDFDSLSWSTVRASRARLDGEVNGGHVILREFSVGDLEGSSAKLVGSGDINNGDVDMAVDAQISQPARTLRLFGIEAPAILSRFAPFRVTGTMRRQDADLATEISAVAPGLRLDLETRSPGRHDPGASPPEADGPSPQLR